MADSPVFFPQLAKGYTIPTFALSPTRTFSQSTRLPTNFDSNLISIPGGISPSILLSDESPRVSNQIVWPPNLAMRQDSKSFGPKMTLDDKTIAYIEQLVDERQLSYRSPRGKDKMVLFKEGSVDAANQKIIEKVETFIKIKGLEHGAKDKQFENKLEIFEQVKTYVDTRKLFEIEEVRGSPSHQMKRLQTQESTPSWRLTEPKTARDSYQDSSPTLKNFKFIIGSESPVNLTKKQTQRSQIEDLSMNIDTVQETLTEEDRKQLEIRALYQQLKESTIQKFGPELFEKAKKRLRNPAHRKMLDMKRGEEISNMRKLREELGDLDIGRKLMDNLLQKSPSTANLQEGTSNNFDNYVKNELKEEKPKQQEKGKQEQKSFTLPLDFTVYEIRQTEPDTILGDISSRVTQTEEEPQIQLLWKVQQHKQKSEEMLKALRNKIVSVQKKEKNDEMLRSPRSSRGPMSPRKSKYSKGLMSEDFRNSARSNLLIPPIMLKLDKDSTTPLNLQKETSCRSSSRVLLIKNSSTPQLRLDLDRTPVETETDVYKGEQLGSPNVVKKNGRNLTVTTKGLQQILPKKKNKSISALALHKNQLMGICNDLESLATKSKDLNKQVEASIKEMSNSYAKKSNIMKDQEIPESLRKPVPDSFIKSTSKLANNLAAKIYRTVDMD